MLRFILSTLATAAAFWIVTALVPGLLSYDGEAGTLIILALIFGVVNGLIGPIVRLLALPLTVVTFGLFGVVINAGLLLLVAGVAGALDIGFVVGEFPPTLFSVETLIAAVVSAIVLGLVNSVVHAILPG